MTEFTVSRFPGARFYHDAVGRVRMISHNDKDGDGGRNSMKPIIRVIVSSDNMGGIDFSTPTRSSIFYDDGQGIRPALMDRTRVVGHIDQDGPLDRFPHLIVRSGRLYVEPIPDPMDRVIWLVDHGAPEILESFLQNDMREIRAWLIDVNRQIDG